MPRIPFVLSVESTVNRRQRSVVFIWMLGRLFRAFNLCLGWSVIEETGSLLKLKQEVIELWEAFVSNDMRRFYMISRDS